MTPLSSMESGAEPVRIERWPTEGLLMALVALVSAALWLLLTISVIGLAYAVLIGLLLFFTHLAFVAYVRGNGVRLGPDQFPEVYHRVGDLSRMLGMKMAPEAYLIQAGGALNAIATVFLRSEIVVLFSDLLEACGDDEAARDMIIGHELGHLRAGHLKWRWFLVPGMLFPFLGAAYSRAREYTCDRYGAAVCRDARGALLGLCILAAGGSHGRRVNMEVLARQQSALDTGWMTIGTWLSSHPPISQRLAALQPGLVEGVPSTSSGRLRALLILAAAVAIPMLGAGFFARTILPEIRRVLQENAPAASPSATPLPVILDAEKARLQVEGDMALLAEVISHYEEMAGHLPEDGAALYGYWPVVNRGISAPKDPFDGLRYGYTIDEGAWYLWSVGPDQTDATDDDIWYDADGVIEP